MGAYRLSPVLDADIVQVEDGRAQSGQVHLMNSLTGIDQASRESLQKEGNGLTFCLFLVEI